MVNIKVNRTLSFQAAAGQVPTRLPNQPCRYVVFQYQGDSTGYIHGVGGDGSIDTAVIYLGQNEQTRVLYCDNLNQFAYSGPTGDVLTALIGL
jgi:hypothetical protein